MNYKTVRELSEEWGISRQAIQKRIKSLPKENHPKKVDGRYVISPETVALLEEKYPNENKVDTNVEPDPTTEKSLVDGCLDELDTGFDNLYKEKEVEVKPEKTKDKKEVEADTPKDSPSQNETIEIPLDGMSTATVVEELRRDKQNLYSIISGLEERLKENQNLLNQQQQLTLQSNKQIQQLQLQLTGDVQPDKEDVTQSKDDFVQHEDEPEEEPIKTKETYTDDEYSLELKELQEKLEEKERELGRFPREDAPHEDPEKKSFFSRMFSKRNQ